jgi:hypothetical protein
MKNKLTLLLLPALLMSACRTLHVGDFHSNTAVPERLPRLGLLVHERSFLEAFDMELAREMGWIGGPYGPETWFEYATTDQALEDVFRLFDNEINDNVSTTSGAAYGHARFKLIQYERRNTGWGWLIPSIGTMWAANVVGMPYSRLRSELELQLEITDANKKVLIRYTAPGVGKATQAMYYGYTKAAAIRKANLLALQDAMLHIKQKMTADVPMLTDELIAAGELKKTSK